MLGETKHHIHEWVYLLLGGCSKQNKIDHQFHVQIIFFNFELFAESSPSAEGIDFNPIDSTERGAHAGVTRQGAICVIMVVII